jgi:hypothetical protein
MSGAENSWVFHWMGERGMIGNRVAFGYYEPEDRPDRQVLGV